MEDPTPHAIAALTALGEMRVWSVLVTIFGDAAQPRGSTVPATALQAILERIGIKPEAMRVALHRLVKDGWIARERAGRQSFYGLTQKGEAEFGAARRRIYAPAPALSDPWRLVVTETRAEGLIPLGRNAFLSLEGGWPEDALVVTGTLDALPDWASQALAPEPLPDEYAALEAALSEAQNTVVTEAAEAAALRILVIHQWRRLLLRHPDLPAAFFPEGWRGEACRALVLSLHRQLSEQADPWLDEMIGAKL
jgi:phenylacetic acid degradation operon negative regulatory protein